MKKKLARRVVLTEEFMALAGNTISALILRQFLYWLPRMNDFDDFVIEEKKLDSSQDYKHGWIYKTAKELQTEIMVSESEETVRKYLNCLVKAGWLKRQSNQKHKWDKTYQYRVNVKKIETDLNSINYSLQTVLGKEFDTIAAIFNEPTSKMYTNKPKCKSKKIIKDPIQRIVPLTPDNLELLQDTLESNPKSLEALPETTTNNTSEKKDSKNNLSDQQKIVGRLSKITGLDFKIKRNAGRLAKVANELITAGYSSLFLEHEFISFWYQNDWRGKKGQPPTPEQVLECVGMVSIWHSEKNLKSYDPLCVNAPPVDEGYRTFELQKIISEHGEADGNR